MTARAIKTHENTYLDSVKLLAGSRAILDTEGIVWGAAVTGTPANLETLLEEGFDRSALEGVRANDLVIAVSGNDPELAFVNAEAAMFAAVESSVDAGPSIRTLAEAANLPAPPNLAVISVAGAFASLEAHKALSASMDVLLFSDNVSLEDEIELKDRAASEGLFVMGPGAGTAVIDGVGLGFANAVRPGSIGVVAAAGTGAQEAMTLVHRAGLGITQVIGVGGRDLSDAVNGRMASQAINALEADPATEAILLVSKPPSARVSKMLLTRPATKPLVAVLVGLVEDLEVSPHITVASDIEQGVEALCLEVGTSMQNKNEDLIARVERAVARVDRSRSAISGLFSGGTLCFEAMTLMRDQGLTVFSNTPLEPDWGLEQAPPGAHRCLDLGEEEYTVGRPHPMIDPEARLEFIRSESAKPETAVILLDVVLGYGSHPDPAGRLAPACAEVMAREGGPQVVAYVLGTDNDVQGLAAQRKKLEEVGCIVAATNARAALTATAIVQQDPSISQYRRPN